MENLNKDIKTPFGENMNLSAADENLETESKTQEPKTGDDLVKSLREKYKTTGGKAYEVKVSFNEDDAGERSGRSIGRISGYVNWYRRKAS